MKVKATVLMVIKQEWVLDIPKEEVKIFTSASLRDDEIDNLLPVMDKAITTIEKSVEALTPTSGLNTKFISQKFEDIETQIHLWKEIEQKKQQQKKETK